MESETAVRHRLTRRNLLRNTALGATALMLPEVLVACTTAKPAAVSREDPNPDLERLTSWVNRLRSELSTGLGAGAARVGELATGTPYEPNTLETYLKHGGTPRHEPLTLSLTRFDCVTLVEACLAVTRLAKAEKVPTWERFGQEVERMRYRSGQRQGYVSRLHYFSEWITDGEKRGLVRDIGAELSGAQDTRPLRFMTEHRGSYPALSNDDVFREIGAIERGLDGRPRRVVPAKRIPEVVNRIEHGDVLAFATEIPGLDVSHAAFAYRDPKGILRVLHAPLSGGVVEITRATLPEYVAAIRRCTGILVARPKD